MREEYYAALSAGDSRVYLLRGQVLTQLIRDHSLVQELVEAGELTADQAEGHPQANVVTRAVGAGDGPLVLDKVIGDIQPGDRFLLRRDGVSKMLSNQEIAASLAAPDGAAPAKLLIAAAWGSR